MSRLGSLSANAIQAMFAQETSETLVCLLTITGEGITNPIRLADNYTGRLSETDDDVIYGLTSNGENYIFMPFNITLPTEEQSATPRCQLIINDVTRYLIPTIRTITSPPNVQIDLVLKSSLNQVEITFGGFILSNITYNANTITCDLTVESLAIEPFPSHTFTPSSFPGMF